MINSLGLKCLALLASWTIVGVCGGGMEVDLFVHKDKFGKSLTLDIGNNECTNVPRLWANLTQSVDTHGSCMQFYDRKNCKGRIAVIQPFHTVHQMDLSLINFHNTIESLSPCGAKVPSGRYVIQSAVDASMLTVQKAGNEFAKVNTLPPQSFIPKAQQWEISEKQPNEYDVMPRIHETNYPVTYDGDSMKKGSFIRKVWKIESVGRGRYIIKSEWTQKCLYKTKIRTVEEHDCRAWSPNQEWVLRPLIAPTKPPPTPDPQLADGVNFQVPSKVVDKYLQEQKRLREKEKQNKQNNSERNGAFLEPYKIIHRKNKPNNQKQEESSEEEDISSRSSSSSKYRDSLTQEAPPGPEIMYGRPSPIFSYEPRPHGKLGTKELAYMDGIAPIFQDAKIEDPAFPDFLLHATSYSDEDVPRYQVTRRPIHMPEGHPDFVAPKQKYDGRIKDKTYTAPQTAKSGGRDDNDGGESGEDENTQSDEQNSGEDEEDEQEEQEKKNKQTPQTTPGYFLYDTTTTQAPTTSTVSSDKSEESGEEEDEEEDEDASQEDEKKTVGVVENSNVVGEKKEEEEVDLGDDDPGRDVAGFMKLLFQGINTRISQKDPTNQLQELLKKKKK